MGGKKFFKIKIVDKNSDFYGKVFGEVGKVTKLKDFGGKRLCSDASLMIYRSILAFETPYSLTDGNGRITTHINTIFNSVLQQANFKIEQLWIFDSPIPNPMKKRESERRGKRREDVKASTSSESVKEKVAYKLNTEHVEEIQLLLKYMGITYVVAPPEVEAEQYGAFLTKGSKGERFCEYMISGDSDVLLFGGNLLRVVSEKSKTGKSKKTVYQAFELEELLDAADLTYDDLLNVAVSLGTDWNEKALGVGPATAIKKCKSNGIYVTEAMKKAIEYFKSDISKKIGKTEFVSGKYDRDALIAFLTDRKFNIELVKKKLDSYEKTFS